MAKVKNKRNARLADKVNKKKNSESFKKKLNPFEVHINKEKIQVLGKKSKHDRGLPGVSRAKAIQKRKETLGTEMKLMNKTNTFIDRRIGEKNNQLSAEDRMVARFAAERVKQHGKKSIYNLADDEILTHRGQTLEQIEKFDDPRSSDDEEEDGKKFGGLDDDFVSEGHFGGGILSKTESRDGAKSHKDLIEQLIAESKKRKAEKQKEKEQTLDLTEKLDSEWKDLQPVLFKRPRVEEKVPEKESAIEKVLNKAEKNSEDYDKMMRELRFEKRGTPSDGLKSDEKKDKEEKLRLYQLELEREQRMHGDDEFTATVIQKKTPKHRSADDLDDNFDLDDEQNFMLAYDKDGKPLVPDEVLKDFSVPNAKPKFNDGISDSSSDDEEGDDSSEEEDDEKEKVEEVNKNNESESSEDESETEKKSNNDDSKSKIESQSVEDNPVNSKISVNEKTANNTKKETTNKSILFNDNDDHDDDDDEEEEGSDDEENDDMKNCKQIDDFKDLRESEESEDESAAERDGDKINSFFDLKLAEGDNLKELLTGKTPSQQSIALQKLIKSYDPSLSHNNKELLSRLFAHMLQYVNDIFANLTDESDTIKAFLIFDKLAPHIYDLAQTNKVSSKKFIVEILKEKRDKYMRKRKLMPNLDTLIFFKLISLLYPTSDFRHPVATPALLFMAEILTFSKFDSAYAISRGFFLTTMVLEYTVLSKRLVPAAINFLRGILYLAADTSVLNPIQVVPPFRLHKDSKILNLKDDCSKMVVGNKMAAKDFTATNIDNDFKIRCLNTCIGILKEFFDYFNDIEAQHYLFEPHLAVMGRIDVDLYPKKMGKKIQDIVRFMKQSLEVKTFTPMTEEKKRPKALRLYEPDVQEVFTGSKSSKLSREQAETARLQSKYKKEMKGALREIRRDKAYIGSVKLRQKIHSDNMRREKVKQIYKDASIQQGELNKLKRGK